LLTVGIQSFKRPRSLPALKNILAPKQEHFKSVSKQLANLSKTAALILIGCEYLVMTASLHGTEWQAQQ
jgi:hypothetical protein